MTDSNKAKKAMNEAAAHPAGSERVRQVFYIQAKEQASDRYVERFILVSFGHIKARIPHPDGTTQFRIEIETGYVPALKLASRNFLSISKKPHETPPPANASAPKPASLS